MEVEVCVWHHAFGLISPKEKLGKILVCSAATNLETLGRNDVDARNITDEVWSPFSVEPTSMWGQVLLSKKHRKELNTFCTCFANGR